MVEDYPTSKGTKRGRDGNEVADDTPLTQCHRSTRNSWIGSGFHNQLEDPVLISDEVGDTKAGVNEEVGDGG